MDKLGELIIEHNAAVKEANKLIESIEAMYYEIVQQGGQCKLCTNWHYPHCGSKENKFECEIKKCIQVNNPHN